jgi:hypothetical protein
LCSRSPSTAISKFSFSQACVYHFDMARVTDFRWAEWIGDGNGLVAPAVAMSCGTKRRSAFIDHAHRRGAISASLIFCLIAVASRASAEVNLSFPLQGHYRAGRYMPVRITTANETGVVTIDATAAMPTAITVNAGTDVIVPWLATSTSLKNVHWSMNGHGPHAVDSPMVPAGDDEKLVGFAGEPPGDVAAVFPGNRIVPVALDLSRPLLEPVQAWETLDAIVLSPAALARLDENHRGLLVASGMTLAVGTDAAPDVNWPWERLGKYWVLRHHISGPTTAIVPSAYLPTYGWERGWPASFRRSVIFIVILFCIFGTGVLLWRSRWSVAIFVALCAITIGGFTAWYASQSPVLQLTAGVMTRHGPMSQFDLWTWESPIRGSTASFPAAGFTHPVFDNRRQIEQSQIRLECTPDGQPDRFMFNLEANQSLAFLTRLVRLDDTRLPLLPASRSLGDFVGELYLGAGEHAAGQFEVNNPYTGAATPVVLINRQPGISRFLKDKTRQ